MCPLERMTMKRMMCRILVDVWNQEHEVHPENLSAYKQAKKMCLKEWQETAELQSLVDAVILDKAIYVATNKV